MGDTGVVQSEGVTGAYWTSSVNGSNAGKMVIGSTFPAYLNNAPLSHGMAVRCIKD